MRDEAISVLGLFKSRICASIDNVSFHTGIALPEATDIFNMLLSEKVIEPFSFGFPHEQELPNRLKTYQISEKGRAFLSEHVKEEAQRKRNEKKWLIKVLVPFAYSLMGAIFAFFLSKL